MRIDEVLHAEPDGDGLRFTPGRELYGAFEGVFGGAIAAVVLRSARRVAGGRTAVSLDCQFLRSLPAGPAAVTAEVVRAGQVLTFVRVGVADHAGRLAATAQATFAEPAALHDLDAPDELPAAAVPSYADAGALPPMAPIMETLAPRFARLDDGSIASLLLVPWDEPDCGPEAACLAADLSVGPPVGHLLSRERLRLATPNPDLSLRFLGEQGRGEVAGVTGLAGASGGVATTRIGVLGDAIPMAVGCSSTLLLGARA